MRRLPVYLAAILISMGWQSVTLSGSVDHNLAIEYALFTTQNSERYWARRLPNWYPIWSVPDGTQLRNLRNTSNRFFTQMGNTLYIPGQRYVNMVYIGSAQTHWTDPNAPYLSDHAIFLKNIAPGNPNVLDLPQAQSAPGNIGFPYVLSNIGSNIRTNVPWLNKSFGNIYGQYVDHFVRFNGIGQPTWDDERNDVHRYLSLKNTTGNPDDTQLVLTDFYHTGFPQKSNQNISNDAFNKLVYASRLNDAKLRINYGSYSGNLNGYMTNYRPITEKNGLNDFRYGREENVKFVRVVRRTPYGPAFLAYAGFGFANDVAINRNDYNDAQTYYFVLSAETAFRPPRPELPEQILPTTDARFWDPSVPKRVDDPIFTLGFQSKPEWIWKKAKGMDLEIRDSSDTLLVQRRQLKGSSAFVSNTGGNIWFGDEVSNDRPIGFLGIDPATFAANFGTGEFTVSVRIRDITADHYVDPTNNAPLEPNLGASPWLTTRFTLFSEIVKAVELNGPTSLEQTTPGTYTVSLDTGVGMADGIYIEARHQDGTLVWSATDTFPLTDTHTSSFVISAFDRNVTYRVRARAIRNGNNGEWSDLPVDTINPSVTVEMEAQTTPMREWEKWYAPSEKVQSQYEIRKYDP